MSFIPFLVGICIIIYVIRGIIRNYKFKRIGKRTKGIVADVIREGRTAYLFVSFADENGQEVSGYAENLKFGTLGYIKGNKISVCYLPETPGSFIVASEVATLFQIGGILLGLFQIGLSVFLYLHQ